MLVLVLGFAKICSALVICTAIRIFWFTTGHCAVELENLLANNMLIVYFS